MKIWIVKSYKWGNKRTLIHFPKYGYMSIIIRGLCIEILYNRKEWISFSKRIANLFNDSWEKWTFPIPIEYLKD